MNDLLLDNDMDLQIEAGDLVIDEAEEQCQQTIMIATKGSFRRWPIIGVSIFNWLKSRLTLSQKNDLQKKIKLNMEYDGYSNVAVTINSSTDITITAER